MAMGSTQLLTAMNTMGISWGLKTPGALAENLDTFMCWI